MKMLFLSIQVKLQVIATRISSCHVIRNSDLTMHLRRQLEVIHQFEWSTKSNPKARLRKELIDLIKCSGKLRSNLLNNSLIIMTSRLQPNVKPTYVPECLKVLSFTSHLRRKVLIRRKKRLLCRTTQISTLTTS